jgi:hypothetical protein
MKMIRNITILAGLSVALIALAATSARAQVLWTTHFTGTFTLPVHAQWGAMTLPADDYTLRYGTQENGRGLVVVRGTAKGSPYGMIFAGPGDDVAESNNALLCIREGDTLYVRALELPAIGESIHFRIPHGVEVRSRLVQQSHNQSGKTTFAQVAIGITRVPVKANGK